MRRTSWALLALTVTVIAALAVVASPALDGQPQNQIAANATKAPSPDAGTATSASAHQSLSPAFAELPGVSSSDAQPPGPYRLVIRFEAMPQGLSVGEDYFGAEVRLVDPTLRLAAIQTSEPISVAATIQGLDIVVSVRPDPLVHVEAFNPNDPRFPDQYGPQQVRAPEAWETTRGGAGASLCILDTGVRATHEDLAGPRWQGGIDLHYGDLDPVDAFGHGTHVTGIAAATIDNDRAIAGMANVDFRHVQVLSDTGIGYSSTVASGIRWCADNGGENTVISMSLGSTSPSSALEDAVDYARSKDALLVAAAGNRGPCTTSCITYPAAFPGVMAIACTTPDQARCSFSSQGTGVDLAAPGSSVVSLWHTTDTALNTLSGTSMSTPHVAGAAALVWSHAPDLTAEELRGTLASTATDLGADGPDQDVGAGLLDTAAALAATDPGTPSPKPPEIVPILETGFDDGGPPGLETTGLAHVTDRCVTSPSPPLHLAFHRPDACSYATGDRAEGQATIPIDLTRASVAELVFEHRWETEPYPPIAYDKMLVEASTDDGQTWQTLHQWDSRDDNQPAWTTHTVPLDTLTGQPVDLRFRFDSVDEIANGYDGWSIDDVRVLADAEAPPPAPNQPPTAEAGSDRSANDADGTGGEFIQLDATASTDPDGSITGYTWTDDGAQIATGATPLVDLAVGTHTLTLTVRDDDGATSQDTATVTVYPNQPPTARLSTTDEAATVTVDGTASSDPEGPITVHRWTWGDGTSATTGATAEHTYATDGTYTVTLTVTDAGGATDTASETVTVTTPTDPTPPGTVYSVDMDHGLPDWTLSSNTASLWRIGSGCLGSASGDRSLQFNRFSSCTYATGRTVDGWARSPVIDLSGTGQATLAFEHAWRTETWSDPYDLMRVQVSDDGGATWDTIEQWDSRDENRPEWHTVTADVSKHATDAFQLRFVFDSRDELHNGYPGWAIDDVRITAG